MCVSGLLRCLVHFISAGFFFSDGGFKRREWMTHWLSSFPKPLICPLELCFLSALVWLQTPLWWRRITPALFLTERNTLSLRMSLNHQCPENLFMYTLFFFSSPICICVVCKIKRQTHCRPVKQSCWISMSPGITNLHKSKNRIKTDYLICWSWPLPLILVSQ